MAWRAEGTTDRCFSTPSVSGPRILRFQRPDEKQRRGRRGWGSYIHQQPQDLETVMWGGGTMKIHPNSSAIAAPTCKETTPNLQQTCQGPSGCLYPSLLLRPSRPSSETPGRILPSEVGLCPRPALSLPPGAVAHGEHSHWSWRKQGLEAAVLIGRGASAKLGSLASRWGKPSRRQEQPGASEGDRAIRTRGSQPVDRGRGLEVRVTRPGARGRPF